MSRPKNPPGLCKNTDVTVEVARIAERRVMPHLCNQNMVDFDLKKLLVNAYLQGCLDMADSLAMERMKAEL